jgi:hypothetical protein
MVAVSRHIRFFLAHRHKKKSQKDDFELSETESKLEKIALEKKFGRGKFDNHLARKIRKQYARPIEPSDDPHRDGIVSLILFIGFFVVFVSIPLVNLAGSIIGLIYGIRAKRGGEETLGLIGLIGNAIALGISIVYGLVLLFYLLYFIFILGLILI